MEQLNRVELRGTVGNVRTQTVGERTVANFTLATNYAYKGKDGNAVIETTWHNVVAWEGKGICELKEIRKGDKLYVLGRFRTQKYVGADDQERISYEVNAMKVSKIECDDHFQYEYQ